MSNHCVLGSILDGRQFPLQETSLHLNLMGDKGQKWRVIGYMVVKCLSYFLVSQPSSGHSESEEEEDITKRKSGKNLHYWSLYVKNEDTHQFFSVA